MRCAFLSIHATPLYLARILHKKEKKKKSLPHYTCHTFLSSSAIPCNCFSSAVCDSLLSLHHTSLMRPFLHTAHRSIVSCSGTLLSSIHAAISSPRNVFVLHSCILHCSLRFHAYCLLLHPKHTILSLLHCLPHSLHLL